MEDLSRYVERERGNAKERQERAMLNRKVDVQNAILDDVQSVLKSERLEAKREKLGIKSKLKADEYALKRELALTTVGRQILVREVGEEETNKIIAHIEEDIASEITLFKKQGVVIKGIEQSYENDDINTCIDLVKKVINK